MVSLGLLQLEWLFYALLAVIIVILGILVAYVVTANRRQRRRMIAAYEADKMAPRPATKVTGQILSLVRGELGGPLQVEIDGRKYSRLAEIEDPQVRRQVLDCALELVQFTGVLDQGMVVAPTPIDETDSWREDVRENSQIELQRIRTDVLDAASAAEATSAHGEFEEQFLGLLSDMGRTVPPPEKPSVMGALRRRRIPKLPEEDPRSFVDDIEDIVQRRLRTVPALAGRGLHVQPSDSGMVCFVFEGSEYGSLEAIPNLTAQQLVQDAINEWNEGA